MSGDTQRNKIVKVAVELLEKAGPDGIGRTKLKDAISSVMDDVNENSIQGAIHVMISNKDKYEITKIERGLYRLSKFDKDVVETITEEEDSAHGYREQDYYEPFAKYLEEVLEECEFSLPLGESRKGGGLWGNPDVIAVKKFERVLNVPPVIVTAEIKVKEDPNAILKGFGQCCAYKLFSHKVYLVVPNCRASQSEGSLVDMCRNHQIGLVVFDKEAGTDDPKWETILRAPTIEPDYSDLNDRWFSEGSEEMKKLQDFLRK